jgi:hypothetical protein
MSRNVPMSENTDHRLVYDYTNDSINAYCCCGGWTWEVTHNERMLPLQAFNAVEAEYRGHVGQHERQFHVAKLQAFPH